LPFYYLAKGLENLLDTARREMDSDHEAAKASLITASRMLQAEVERCSGANNSARGGLAVWQIVRVQAYIDSNLHRTIHIRDLSSVARRSPAHFSRKFKLTVGESPHAYVVSRRLERACHLMMTSAEPLSKIALSVGFSDQAHLCRLFRQAFGQSPANWRRKREIPGESPREPAWKRMSMNNKRGNAGKVFAFRYKRQRPVGYIFSQEGPQQGECHG
jgi:AraC-like DNA-binding protein